MGQIIILSIISALLVLSACQNVDVSKLSDTDMQRIAKQVIVCDQPYIRFETGCCLDQNINKICDNDEVVNSQAQAEKTTPPGLNPPIENPPANPQHPINKNEYTFKCNNKKYEITDEQALKIDSCRNLITDNDTQKYYCYLYLTANASGKMDEMTGFIRTESDTSRPPYVQEYINRYEECDANNDNRIIGTSETQCYLKLFQDYYPGVSGAFVANIAQLSEKLSIFPFSIYESRISGYGGLLGIFADDICFCDVLTKPMDKLICINYFAVYHGKLELCDLMNATFSELESQYQIRTQNFIEECENGELLFG